ncbi:MAG: DUF881 domain-containing protein [Antricoccus sp.]
MSTGNDGIGPDSTGNDTTGNDTTGNENDPAQIHLEPNDADRSDAASEPETKPADDFDVDASIAQTSPDDTSPDDARVEVEPISSVDRKRSRLGLRPGLIIGVLCLLLGFGVAIQVRSNSAANQNLAGARQEDLVRILDDLDSRHDRLQSEIAALNDTDQQLTSGGDQAAAAQVEAQKKADQLAILAGTIGAKGPGISMIVTDPKGQLSADVVLNIIQELRAAGAEAIEIGKVRIGVNSAVSGDPGLVQVDGQSVPAPITVLAIGDPNTLNAAMSIPGGVVPSVKLIGGAVSITNSAEIQITAIRALSTQSYADPATPTK